jgi:hypothetical protein
MKENLYEVWDEDECIASNMNVDNACIFIHGYMDLFSEEEEIELTIRRMSNDPTV